MKKQVKTIKGLKTINIDAIEWFDKVNGNTYFASVITLNKGYATETTLYNEFQYGHGNQYKYEAFREIERYLKINRDTLGYNYLDDRNIIVTTTMRDGLKRELKNIKN